MIGHGDKLIRKQDQAISALLTSPTVKAAAECCGVSVATLQRWQQLPEFSTAYRLARRRVIDQATGQLTRASVDAVAVLSEVMHGEAQPGAVRVSAAKAVLDYAYKSYELEELVARVAALEEQSEAPA